jgi:hypothetical protein
MPAGVSASAAVAPKAAAAAARVAVVFMLMSLSWLQLVREPHLGGLGEKRSAELTGAAVKGS